jgi:hypothetical protein
VNAAGLIENIPPLPIPFINIGVSCDADINRVISTTPVAVRECTRVIRRGWETSDEYHATSRACARACTRAWLSRTRSSTGKEDGSASRSTSPRNQGEMIRERRSSLSLSLSRSSQTALIN